MIVITTNREHARTRFTNFPARGRTRGGSRIGRDLVEKIQRREVAFIERNAALALARCDARALVAAGELAVAVGEHRGAIGRRRLLAGPSFAEAVVVVAAVERLEELRGALA